MLTPIVLEYNKKYLKLKSLYKINLYYIDNEYYIDMDEIKKIINYFHYNFDDKVFSEHICGVNSYNEENRQLNDNIYIEQPDHIKEQESINTYIDVSIEHYLLYQVEKIYENFIKIIKKYEEHLQDLNNFKKPNNTFKQIISQWGEIIYVINFKKIINDIDSIYYTNIDEKKRLNLQFYNIKIKIENIFNINKLYPLDLKKILTIKKINEINNTTTYDYNEIIQKNKALNAEFKRVAKLMKLT